MLDIKFIRENQTLLKKAIADKALNFDLDAFLDLDGKRKSLLLEVESMRAAQNQVSKQIPHLQDTEKQTKILEMKEVSDRLSELEQQLRVLNAEWETQALHVPNIPSHESPIGPDDSANVPWLYWSPETGRVQANQTDAVSQVPKKFDFEPKDHATLMNQHDLLDLDAGSETAGFRGYYLKNEAVLLSTGVMWLALQKLRNKGFTLMIPPTLLREFALIGSGHFPNGRGEVYQVGNAARLENEHKEQLFLGGTSEPALLAYCANKIFTEAELPLKLCGISPCYRSEIGSHGKDAKGLYRVHEFWKVEQVVVSVANLAESEKHMDDLRMISEELLQDLELPYRVLNIATGDMGAGKYKQYDIETWMPSRNNFGETHSDSNLTDWQARRLNIRYRAADGSLKYAYTLNNTAAATPRLLIPIIENYQQADGTIAVPKALQPFVGSSVIGQPMTAKSVTVETPVNESEHRSSANINAADSAAV